MRRIFAVVLLFSSVVAAQQSGGTPPKSQQQNTLQPVPTQHEAVVVTGSYEPVPLDEVDRTVQVLDVQQSPTLYRNWDEVLKDDPSIDLRQRATGIEGDLSVRGSTFGQTLVLVNGVRMNNVQTGHHNLDLPIPFEAVQRVEVLHGSGSTLYGSDAFGGAVNFITAPPAVTELRVGAGIGNFGTNQQNVSAAYVTKRWSEQAAMTRELSTGFTADRDYRNLAFVSETTARSALGLTDVLLGYGDRPFGADLFYGNYNSWERTKSWFSSIQQQLGANTSAVFGYRRHSDVFILLRNNPSVYENNHIDESYQAALRRNQQLARNVRIFYGGEGYHDSIDSSNLGSHRRDRGAVYADLDVRALHRFSFAAGAREEFFTGGQRDFSPTVSGGYWLSQHIKLKASASHAFRLPTYTDLYYHDPANSGNPNLRPERAWDYEGGAHITLLSKLSSDLTVFNRREHNDIDYVRASANEVWQAENLTNVTFTGFEAALRINVARNQRFDLGYSLLHGNQDAIGGLQSQYVFQYPSHAATASWLGTLPGQVTSRVRLQVVQRVERDPYPLLDLSLTRDFRRLRPYLQLTNITNTSYAEILGPPSVPMPGRGVIAGVEVSLVGKH